MPIDLNRYNQLKARHEQKTRAAAEARGALNQQMRKLVDDFQVTTLDAAKQQQQQLQTDLQAAVTTYNEKLAAYESQYGGK